ncbi:MAG TPA: tocopherol cyclase family protein [Phototrophicaceae bacterium]|nr:tocopherol cyclase family protein [Phototrophicaceae bacterium]
MPNYFQTTLNPAGYHGGKPPFFEGWYFKLVSADRSRRFAVIPGVFLSDDPAKAHAFVQVFDGVSGQATFHRYPLDQFEAQPGEFDVRIGANRFRLDWISLNIDDELRTVKGDLRFGTAIPWPVTLTEPGVMGWFGWLPIMECYHGVLSMDHTLTGALTVDGQPFDFTGGRGYIEKDWGRSFPGGWVWMQSNHFEQPGTSFTASIAITPLLGRWFPGFLAGLWHEGQFHRFATYTGAKVEKLVIHDETVEWVISSSRLRLEIVGHRASTSILPGPDRVEMGKRVPETLKASLDLRLTDSRSNRVLFAGRGECAGLEVAGDIDKLLRAL